MHALSEQFKLIDGLRKAAGIAPARLAHRARIPFLRYELFLVGMKEPKRRELRALEHALRTHPLPASDSASRTSRTSPSAARAGTAAAHAPGVPSGRRLIRDPRIAPPPANSGEGV